MASQIGDLAGRVIYRTKDDVTDWNGDPLFPGRQVNRAPALRGQRRYRVLAHAYSRVLQSRRADDGESRPSCGRVAVRAGASVGRLQPAGRSRLSRASGDPRRLDADDPQSRRRPRGASPLSLRPGGRADRRLCSLGFSATSASRTIGGPRGHRGRSTRRADGRRRRPWRRF